MNDKHKRFCEFFAASGNATDAAKKAGYSERTAYSQGNRLLKNDECAEYIRELQDQAAAARIADIEEVKTTWTEILRDKAMRAGNRIRAGELLARSSGEMIPGSGHRSSSSGDDYPLHQSDQYDDVALPMIDGSGDFNAIETENGDVIPLQGHEEGSPLIYVPFRILKMAFDSAACELYATEPCEPETDTVEEMETEQ